jgi:DNA-binding NarL/FixJ family response regulator
MLLGGGDQRKANTKVVGQSHLVLSTETEGVWAVKILVADDHPLIREALGHVLRELDGGVAVLEAADGETVKRLAAEHPDLDLVLLDIFLPGVRGLELFDELRSSYPTLPLVAVSALDDASTVKAVLAGGAMGFIPKSSSHPLMVSALRLVLSGGRYLPPELMAQEWAFVSGRATTLGTRGPVSAAALGLTERQHQVLGCIAQGKSNKQICRELGLAEATVKIHVTAILKALKVTSRTQAVVMINELGLRLDPSRESGGRPADP